MTVECMYKNATITSFSASKLIMSLVTLCVHYISFQIKVSSSVVVYRVKFSLFFQYFSRSATKPFTSCAILRALLVYAVFDRFRSRKKKVLKIIELQIFTMFFTFWKPGKF